MTTTAPHITPLAPLSRQAIRRQLESEREAVAQQIWLHTSAISTLNQLMKSNTILWEGTQPDSAPAFEPRFQMDRAS